MQPTRERPKLIRDGYELLLVVLMAAGAVVMIEPAPFDLLVVLLLPAGLLLRRLAIPKGAGFALACVALYLLANLLSLLEVAELGRALRFGAITLYLIVAWLLVLGVVGKLGERGLQLLFLGWAIGAAGTTAVATASYLGLLPFAELMAPGGRMLGLFKDPNVYGAFLVGPAVWASARLVALERGRRLPWVITLLACGAGVLLSYSRGAWISMAVALLVFFVLRMVAYGSPRARVMTLLMVPVAAVLLTLALDRLASVDAVQNMLDQRLGMQRYDVDRFATQRAALEAAAELPLGLGPGQSEGYFTRATHNTYIHSLVETGYLGGLTFTLILIASLLRASWMALDARDPKLQTAMAVVAGSMAAICVESMVIDSIHWRHLWILAAMAWTPGARGRAKAALDKVAGP